MLRIKLSILVCLSLVFSVDQVSAQEGVGKLDGVEIVKRMAARYASAKSYQDTGVIQESSGRDKPVISEINSFKTFYTRPDNFRFEWEDRAGTLKGDRYIVWSDGKEVHSYSHLMGLEKEEDLGMAIAGATGISRGSAHTVSVLLMPESSGFRLSEMDRIELLREERFEDIDCYVVKGFHPFGFAIEMWIGKHDLLLRKILDHNKDGTFDIEIRREVILDGDIPATVFQFTPPGKVERLIGCLSVIVIPLGVAACMGIAKDNQT